VPLFTAIHLAGVEKWAALSCGFGPKNKLTNADADAGRQQQPATRNRQPATPTAATSGAAATTTPRRVGCKVIFNGRMKL